MANHRDNSSKNRLWCNLEAIAGGSYPKYFKKILLKAGFDNCATLKLISEKTIPDIEAYVQKNKHLLKNTPYERRHRGRGKQNLKQSAEQNDENFKFSLGERLLLLSIAENIRKIEPKPERDKKKKKIIPSEDTLKSILLKKLQDYSKQTKFNYFLTEKNICKFRNTEEGFKCSVICPICPKSNALTYKSYWNTSNFTNHVRTHYTIETVELKDVIVLNNTDLNNELDFETDPQSQTVSDKANNKVSNVIESLMSTPESAPSSSTIEINAEITNESNSKISAQPQADI